MYKRRSVFVGSCRLFSSFSVNQNKSFRKPLNYVSIICNQGSLNRLNQPTISIFSIDSNYVHTSAASHFTSNTKRYRDLTEYDRQFNRSIANPEEFWAEAASKLVWMKQWDKVMDDSKPPFTHWFVGGQLNTAYNALDRHIEAGHGNQTAIIHDSPVTKCITKVSYNEMYNKVRHLAGVLQRCGVKLGDRVVIYMPMIPEAIAAMLACSRIGAIHCLVFGGFAAKELSVRIDHSKPKVVITANCGVEPGRIVNFKSIMDEALRIGNHNVQKCLIYNRPGFERADFNMERDLDYDEMLNAVNPVDPVPVPSNAPLYIIHTSGTTGIPKAVVRPSGGHAVVVNWSMSNIYGVQPHEVYWAAADLGWTVGHTYTAYAPLLTCCTAVLFEGKPVGTPDASAYFRVLKEHNVVATFIAPTALRAIRQEDGDCKLAQKFLPLDKLRNIFLGGERCDKDTMKWTKEMFKTPVLDHWWQTESGWPMTCSLTGLGMTSDPPDGVTGKPVPGWNVQIHSLDEQRILEANELGRIVVKLPLPPGALSTLWENDEKFVSSYFTAFPGYYDTMDSGYHGEEGYISVLARVDDVINVAGHRISAASIEEAVLHHRDVVDVAVVGVKDKLKGHIPFAFCVLSSDCRREKREIEAEVISVVRERIGPVASLKMVVIVGGLPKTRSGKISRHTLCAMVEGRNYEIPVTIQDADVYPAIESILRDRGIIGT